MHTRPESKLDGPEQALLAPLVLAEQADPAVVAATESRRNQAFEILVGRYRGRILRVALRFTRNREDAEDIVQLSFQKAFVHFQQFEGNSAFSTWLTRIAINEALMWLRRKRASLEVPIEESSTKDEAALPQDFPGPAPNPEDSCLQHEREQILSAAMDELTLGTRTAIQLRELSELSTEETARVMGLSVGAVKARVFQGRRKLRATLKRYVESTWKYKNQALRTDRKANGIASHQLAYGAGD